jgi:hypothetical protein
MDQERRLFPAEKKDEREYRDADRNRDSLSIRLPLPILFCLPNFQTFLFDLLVVKGAG